MPLSNLRALREDMKANERAVCTIEFTYRGKDYFLSVCLLTDEDRVSLGKNARYYLVRLCFMKRHNLTDYIDCFANSSSITAGLTELRHFLGVPYQIDGFGWEGGFLAELGLNIPTTSHPDTAITLPATMSTLCRHEGRDPNRIYRWSMIRNSVVNGKQQYRSAYNGQLASHRFPKLYPLYKADTTVSFGFTDDPLKERSEEDILESFSRADLKRGFTK